LSTLSSFSTRFAVACLMLVVLQSQAFPGDLEIKVEAGLITLEADDVPLSELIHAIAAQSGFEVNLAGEFTDLVTVSLAGVTVKEALDQLVGKIDRFVVYNASPKGTTNRSIQKLWLFAASNSANNPRVSNTRAVMSDDLQSNDANIRSQAILRLSGAGGATEEVLDTLIQALQDDQEPLVRNNAAIALGALHDERAVPALELALEDEHDSVRMQAINALSQIGGERATLALGEILLQDTDTTRRVTAAMGLQKLGTELARSLLDSVADDPDEQVRRAAAK